MWYFCNIFTFHLLSMNIPNLILLSVFILTLFLQHCLPIRAPSRRLLHHLFLSKVPDRLTERIDLVCKPLYVRACVNVCVGFMRFYKCMLYNVSRKQSKYATYEYAFPLCSTRHIVKEENVLAKKKSSEACSQYRKRHTAQTAIK